jgi:hypothetical protein
MFFLTENCEGDPAVKILSKKEQQINKYLQGEKQQSKPS